MGSDPFASSEYVGVVERVVGQIPRHRRDLRLFCLVTGPAGSISGHVGELVFCAGLYTTLKGHMMRSVDTEYIN